jgi:hypothetical protein
VPRARSNIQEDARGARALWTCTGIQIAGKEDGPSSFHWGNCQYGHFGIGCHSIWISGSTTHNYFASFRCFQILLRTWQSPSECILFEDVSWAYWFMEPPPQGPITTAWWSHHKRFSSQKISFPYWQIESSIDSKDSMKKGLGFRWSFIEDSNSPRAASYKKEFRGALERALGCLRGRKTRIIDWWEERSQDRFNTYSDANWTQNSIKWDLEAGSNSADALGAFYAWKGCI